jgi:hypothetical protein
MAEGGEPLPRTPAIWGALRYEVRPSQLSGWLCKRLPWEWLVIQV